ncbi:uncharacterized protein MKZ38_004525 [Zalerion maritima]|uniref:Uncharacterized protein n=1 Tax=Zalerion maritima TaxID=339359 RepID=A0AAD5RLD4_9PEZI|nr:uncharacterized protein MKZ38_004525 [Zalerion maritima]
MPVLSRPVPVSTGYFAATLSRHPTRNFSVSTSLNTAPRRTQDFNAGYTAGYDPNQEMGRGPIFSKNAYGVPQFYPRDLKKRVDEYVVGQDRAKKTISAVVFNHYQKLRRQNHHEEQERLRKDKLRRQRYMHERSRDPMADDQPIEGQNQQHRDDIEFRRYEADDIPEDDFNGQKDPMDQSSQHQESLSSLAANFYPAEEGPSHVKIDKSNLLLIGPTGVGKTYILETLSKKINVPFTICDCNSFTQAGYIGADVETCIERLLIEANYDTRAAEHGIIVLDEFDKIARRETTTGRDVGGEGVQQALLKLVEGTKVTINVKDNRSSRGSSNTNQANPSGKVDQYTIDTSNILFVFCGAFVGLEKMVLSRVARPGMGFGSPLRTKTSSFLGTKDALPLDMYQHLPHQPITTRPSSPSCHHSFTPLDLTSPADLQGFGFIPELIGRVHNIIALSPLSVNDLYRILTEPKNSLVAQYTALFDTYPSTLKFTRTALRALAERAAKSETGARGLKMEMERVLAEPMFDAPMPYVLITKAAVDGKEKPAYWGKDGLFEIERRLRDEDEPNSTTVCEESDFQALLQEGSAGA